MRTNEQIAARMQLWNELLMRIKMEFDTITSDDPDKYGTLQNARDRHAKKKHRRHAERAV